MSKENSAIEISAFVSCGHKNKAVICPKYIARIESATSVLISTLHNINRDSDHRKRSVRIVACTSNLPFWKGTYALTL